MNAVPYERLVAMLDAYAERLEREEGPASLDPHAYARMCREEGRREILREIAMMDPWHRRAGYGYSCYWCDGDRGEEHEPDCLWRRAQEAMKEQG